jgi:Flp pilus assembly pilin Flp
LDGNAKERTMAWYRDASLALWARWLGLSDTDAEDGQGGLEYALVAGVVVVAIITAFSIFPIGSIVSNALTKVQNLTN